MVTGRKPKRRGFLPIQTNWFDRLFIGVISWVALSMLWFRFLEQFASIWFAVLLGAAWTILLIRKG